MSSWNTVLATFWCSPKPDDPCYGKPSWNLDDVFGKECVLPDHKMDEEGLWTRDPKDDEDYRKATEKYRETYNDWRKHPENYLPMGSEGSCEKVFRKTGETAWIVTVFGSLRDREPDDFKEVKAWFERCCSKCDVGCAICRVSNGWSGRSEIYQSEDL